MGPHRMCSYLQVAAQACLGKVRSVCGFSNALRLLKLRAATLDVGASIQAGFVWQRAAPMQQWHVLPG